MAEAAAMALAAAVLDRLQLQHTNFLTDSQDLVNFFNSADHSNPPDWRMNQTPDSGVHQLHPTQKYKHLQDTTESKSNCGHAGKTRTPANAGYSSKFLMYLFTLSTCKSVHVERCTAICTPGLCNGANSLMLLK